MNHCASNQSPQHEYLKAAAPDGGSIPIIVSSRLFSDATVKLEQIKHDSNVLTAFKSCHNWEAALTEDGFFSARSPKEFRGGCRQFIPKVSLSWRKFFFSVKRVIKVIYVIHTGSIGENTYNGRDNEWRWENEVKRYPRRRIRRRRSFPTHISMQIPHQTLIAFKDSHSHFIVSMSNVMWLNKDFRFISSTTSLE